MRRAWPSIKTCSPKRITVRSQQVKVPYTNQSISTKLPDPRLSQSGPLIGDKYATIRDSYQRPKHPILLAHGLMGFDELRLAGNLLPGLQYWRGIKDAFSMKGIEVIIASVPPSASIEQRADELMKSIESGIQGKGVNIIAGEVHDALFIVGLNSDPSNQRGLDARYMISRLRPTKFKVLSLTTIATPHQGSSIADYVFEQIGGLSLGPFALVDKNSSHVETIHTEERLAQVYAALKRLEIEAGAFEQLTTKYVQEKFNPQTPNVDDVRYFSYGATFSPGLWSVFRQSHRILEKEEGPNDGLVSVRSSVWGGKEGYKGTLAGVSHLDLINWTNRLKWLVSELSGRKRKFNAVAFYLDIADQLAKAGL